MGKIAVVTRAAQNFDGPFCVHILYKMRIDSGSSPSALREAADMLEKAEALAEVVRTFVNGLKEI